MTPSTPHHLSTPSRPASRRLSSYRLKSASRFGPTVNLRHLVLWFSAFKLPWNKGCREKLSMSPSTSIMSNFTLLFIFHSSHLHHVPVDKVLFLRGRVKSKARGQVTLVTSEGGCAFFWDMFSSGPPIGQCSYSFSSYYTYLLLLLLCVQLGSFPMTEQEGEVVLAMALDDNCQWLLAGDTAGFLHLFNIEHYCTHHHTSVRLRPTLSTIQVYTLRVCGGCKTAV